MHELQTSRFSSRRRGFESATAGPTQFVPERSSPVEPDGGNETESVRRVERVYGSGSDDRS
ncbi:hypothetical protein C496_08024 [Natronorubrum tibetense GA33]|uniref:Uncharacterized protein n=1 Tax=Natronorubrum tibetense GA33 TaxID=1114856 RepID=L9VXS1_9EURY|nr:hypothetical protein C496_08024 [Natronorubrum tibetense GA33]